MSNDVRCPTKQHISVHSATWKDVMRLSETLQDSLRCLQEGDLTQQQIYALSRRVKEAQRTVIGVSNVIDAVQSGRADTILAKYASKRTQTKTRAAAPSAGPGILAAPTVVASLAAPRSTGVGQGLSVPVAPTGKALAPALPDSQTSASIAPSATTSASTSRSKTIATSSYSGEQPRRRASVHGSRASRAAHSRKAAGSSLEGGVAASGGSQLNSEPRTVGGASSLSNDATSGSGSLPDAATGRRPRSAAGAGHYDGASREGSGRGSSASGPWSPLKDGLTPLAAFADDPEW